MPTKKTVKKAPAKKGSCSCGDDCSCDSCCGGLCRCGKRCWFWTIIVVIIAVVVGYFAYNEYNKSKAPFTVTETNGVTTVTPGPGLVPDGPPNFAPPTTPPPSK